MIRFIDRATELSLLEDQWRKESPEFIILYGRRRIGKTRLILEFIKGKEGFFFIAEDVNKTLQIEELKTKVANYFNDDFLRRTSINDWRDFFDYITKVLPQDQKIFFVIDEFSYLLKNGPSISSILQKFWDTFLSTTKIFFLVSGSLFGLMQDNILSSTSPLYGRRTRDLLLSSLTFEESLEFLNMSFSDKIKTYMSIGGVPEYLLKARDYESSLEFQRKEFFSKYGYFYHEPQFLLSQEFKEIRTYFAILKAIAHGNTRPTEIANFVGLKSRNIYPYLENLIRLDFIRRIVPIIGNKKAGIYIIKDTFFDFWFNFVYNNRENIERESFVIVKNDLNSYFGKRFETLIREEIAYRMFKFPEIGHWWYKDKEIDIVGINNKTEEILFGECKWQDNVDAEKLLKKLKRKAKLVKWKNKKRKERFAIIARSFKKRIKDCQCVDLDDIHQQICLESMA